MLTVYFTRRLDLIKAEETLRGWKNMSIDVILSESFIQEILCLKNFFGKTNRIFTIFVSIDDEMMDRLNDEITERIKGGLFRTKL